MLPRRGVVILICILLAVAALHFGALSESEFNSAQTVTPSLIDSTASKISQREAKCILPVDAASAFLNPPDTTGWKSWSSLPLRLHFLYPPTWSVTEVSEGIVVKPQDHDRNLPFRGDSDQIYGITISTSTDVNALGFITPQSVSDELSSIHFPLQKRWLHTKRASALIVYCIFDYSEGITALIPYGNEVIQVAISRFAEGLTPAEDWVVFFGILDSLQTTTAILR